MQIFQLLNARTVVLQFAFNSPAREFSTPANPRQVGQVVFRVPKKREANLFTHSLSDFDYEEVCLSVGPRNPLSF